MSRIDCKVVLIGGASAGKTCLLERFIHERFNDKTVMTMAGSFAAKAVTVDKNSVMFGCWDTAGCERFATLSRMYYRNARAAIICFDLTSRHSYDAARNWVSELLKEEENCKLYVCGTKKDLVDKDPGKIFINKEDARFLAQELQADYFETSSKTGENIDALFTKIAQDFAKSESLMSFQVNDSIRLSSSWQTEAKMAKRNCCHK